MVYIVGAVAVVIGVATILFRRALVAPGQPDGPRPDVRAQVVIGSALIAVGVLVSVVGALN